MKAAIGSLIVLMLSGGVGAEPLLEGRVLAGLGRPGRQRAGAAF